VAVNSQFAPECERPIVWKVRCSRQLLLYAFKPTPSATVNSTNPVFSLDINTISGTV